MKDKVPRTVYLDPETDEDLGHVAYNLRCNKIEVIKRLIEKGLEEGILEDYSEDEQNREGPADRRRQLLGK